MRGPESLSIFLMFLGIWPTEVLPIQSAMQKHKSKNLSGSRTFNPTPKVILCPGAQGSLLALCEKQSKKEKQLSPDYPWNRAPWQHPAMVRRTGVLQPNVPWLEGQACANCEASPWSADEDMLTGAWG